MVRNRTPLLDLTVGIARQSQVADNTPILFFLARARFHDSLSEVEPQDWIVNGGL